MKVINTLIELKKILNVEIRYKIFLLILLNFISIFFDIVGISMIIPMVIIITEEKEGIIEKFPFLSDYLLNYSTSQILVFAITFFLIFYIFKSLFVTFLTWFDKKFIHLTQVYFSEKLLNKYLTENYLKFLSYNSADLIRNIISESGIFVTSVIHNITNLFVEIILIISVAALLIYFEPIGSSVSITFIAAIVISYIFYFKKKLSFLGKERQMIDGVLIKNLSQAFTLFREVRLFDKSTYLVSKFKEIAKKRAQISIFEQLVNSLPRVYFELMAILSLSFIVYTLVYIKNDISEIIPILSLYTAALFRLIPSANKIIQSINSLNHNLPAFQTVYNDLKNSKDVLINLDNKNLKFEKFLEKKIEIKSIELKDISFSFQSKEKKLEILKNINLELSIGNLTGLIGETGSGKSTIANIISGLIQDFEGKLIINKNNNFDRFFLQKFTGYVSQHVNLIDDTILNNICYGIDTDKIDNEKVEKIINELNLTNLISSLPNKYNHKIGEQGLTLSGGQRQKISLARTLYLNPKVIIFDESTSSLDRETEKDFMKVINEIKKNKIILFITHNKLLEEDFDKIYKIENNSVKEYKIK